MKILVSSPAFSPLVGGLETVLEQLASELTKRGHEVTILTTTPAGETENFPFRVVRSPGVVETLRWMRWCRVFLQANLSLRHAWPLVFVRKPWVVSHHSWYRRPDGRLAWQDRLKRFCLRFATSIAVSDAMARDIGTPCVVIPNAYRDQLFRLLPEASRSCDLVFVGRLVSDKGLDILLDALTLPALAELRPRLTVVGDGPELSKLKNQAARLRLERQVIFLGTRTGEELVKILNDHRVLVVPSRYREPFGIVALEGIACGCRVVGSVGGGLPEAIGPCGRTFPNGDAEGLGAALAELLREPAAPEHALSPAAIAHLERHRGAQMANAYLAVFERLL